MDPQDGKMHNHSGLGLHTHDYLNPIQGNPTSNLPKLGISLVTLPYCVQQCLQERDETLLRGETESNEGQHAMMGQPVLRFNNGCAALRKGGSCIKQ